MFPKTRADAYQRIEAILDEGPFVAGTRAVHRAYFLYSLRWSQAGARISEMNDLGWTITGVLLPESEWQSGVRTGYRLDGKPLSLSEDWYERQTGKPRPAPAKPLDNLPLFVGAKP
jgi:hypothetical protein